MYIYIYVYVPCDISRWTNGLFKRKEFGAGYVETATDILLSCISFGVWWVV